jgi:hypothetical protein
MRFFIAITIVSVFAGCVDTPEEAYALPTASYVGTLIQISPYYHQTHKVNLSEIKVINGINSQWFSVEENLKYTVERNLNKNITVIYYAGSEFVYRLPLVSGIRDDTMS